MLEYGKYYHIYNRGNNREDLFFEAQNYHYFLTLFQRHITPIADTFAYCLMKNHFHLLVRIKDEEEIKVSTVLHKGDNPLYITQQFKNFFIAYSKSINKMYGRTGALFESPFKHIEVDSNNYFTALIHYIHFNPQKHLFTKDFRKYPHSSYKLLVSEAQTFLRRDFIREWFGGAENFVQYHNNAASEKEILLFIGEDQ